MRLSISTNRHCFGIQSATHEDMQLYKTSCKIDLITRFSLRPHELMIFFDMVGKYYRWFNVSSKPLKDNFSLEFLDEYIKEYARIDATKCQILTRKNTLHELVLWLETIENEKY